VKKEKDVAWLRWMFVVCAVLLGFLLFTVWIVSAVLSQNIVISCDYKNLSELPDDLSWGSVMGERIRMAPESAGCTVSMPAWMFLSMID
jgi:hypothetical protein